MRAGLILLPLLLAPPAVAAPTERLGPTADGGALVASRQLLHPAGRGVTYAGGHPFDLVLAPDGKTAYVKGDWSLLVLDAADWSLRQQLGYNGPDGASPHGIAVSADGRKVYVTDTMARLFEALVGSDGKLTWGREISVAGKGKAWTTHPCGLALSRDGARAWVCLSIHNALGVVDLRTGTLVAEIPVGVAPYAVALSPDGRTAWVSNWGGRRPKQGERTAKSTGTDVLVDRAGVAATGTVSVVDVAGRRVTAEIAVGLNPAGMALSADGARLYVACANADTVAVVDTAARKTVASILVRPDPALPYGSAPNALALSPDGATLYAACGGNNAIALIALGRGAPGRVLGFVPSGWYPGGVATDGRALYVAAVKGLGTQDAATRKEHAAKEPEAKAGWSVGWVSGLVTKTELPSPEALAAHTARVLADGRVPEILREREAAQAGAKPVPVPARAGEPSVIKHVLYVIKENRTYDQVLGDVAAGNGMKELCVYGREVTPNQHALAESFVLLDNYYCNGVLSSDGHAWAMEGAVSGYVEKAFGGWTRTYNFGEDALAYLSSGPIWRHALAHGISFRNYGELGDGEAEPEKAPFADTYRAFLSHSAKVKFSLNPDLGDLLRYSCPGYPGWSLRIPDVLRAEIFLKELAEAEAKDAWPAFMFVYLPCDHTSGTRPGSPTPRAQVADNDLALGRIVEGISKSRFWASTCLFVIEDDPQDGFDHVDGHRSVCQVISPYSRGRGTVSAFYNQTAVLHTMERMLGLPPLNQFDALAPVMTACFKDAPDLAPFAALENRIALDEMNPPKAALAPEARRLAEASERLDLEGPDRANEDRLNRILWSASQGADAPYPGAYAGAHGRGLKALGLTASPEPDED